MEVVEIVRFFGNSLLFFWWSYLFGSTFFGILNGFEGIAQFWLEI